MGDKGALAPVGANMTRNGSFTEIKTSTMPIVPCVLCIASAPVAFVTGWWTQAPKEESVIVNCGIVTDVSSTEGCHWHNPCFRSIRTVSTAQTTYDIPRQMITDLHGNPMIVSAVLTYRFDDPKRALLNVQNASMYVRQLAQAALKEVVGKYTYDELKTASGRVSNECVRTLQPRVTTAGCKVVDVTINEISYDTAIATSMLRKQQAEQLIAARGLLVAGAVDIATKALHSLEEEGVELSEAERAKLASDLIVVSISDKSEV